MKVFLLLFVLARCALAADVNLDKPVDSLVLTDGRTLHKVEFVSFSASATMARWEGGRGTLKYEVLPEPFKAAAEKRRPAGSSSSSTARDSLPETALEGTKSAGKLKLGEIALRAIESTESYTHYSWTAKITNNMAEVRRVRTYAVLLDGKAFKLDEAYSDDETIDPGAVVILSGKSLVKTPIWKQVKSYTVEVRE